MKIAKSVLSTLALLSLLLSAGIAQAVARVESRSSNSNAFNPTSEAVAADNISLEFQRKMEFLQQEVQELRGKVEEQNYQLQQLQEQQKKLYLDLDRRLRDAPQASQATKPTSHSGITLEAPENLPSTSEVSSQPLSEQIAPSHPHAMPSSEEIAAEEKAYQNAYHLIQNKEYDKAMQSFKSLVKSFPHGKYLPNSTYWLGEIYFTKGSLDLAYEAFDLVYRQFPQHPKAADSLLKLGYVEYAKGEWKQSQALLSQVKSQFPGSTSAQLADARLQKMHQEGHL